MDDENFETYNANIPYDTKASALEVSNEHLKKTLNPFTTLISE
jgi:hypothetical protein